jgi:phosphinothricin acetyltransferase
LRKATIEDLPEILAIYNEVIKTSPVTFDLQEQTVEERTEWFSGFDEKHPFLVVVKCQYRIGGQTINHVSTRFTSYHRKRNMG